MLTSLYLNIFNPELYKLTREANNRVLFEVLYDIYIYKNNKKFKKEVGIDYIYKK